MSFVPVEIIYKKRRGLELSKEEINFLINGFLDKDESKKIPDYQMSAWLMSVFFNGMSPQETADFTSCMLHSGETIDFSHIPKVKVDKHSTGGVGDKTSLIISPLVAAAGVSVPMIAGRGLGHTGGTLDKLESIPGFNTSLTLEEFKIQVEKTGTAIIGQTKEICPADKKLYALRDVTATVESLPLICGSIMSKKLAEGIDSLVLDVKYGSGAFMKTIDQAEDLAKLLALTGKNNGRSVIAVITSMEQPLGRFIGNSLEVEECISIMKNESIYGLNPEKDFADMIELTAELSGQMIWQGKQSATASEGKLLAKKLMTNGQAYEKFAEVCHQQGGNLEKLPKATQTIEVVSPNDGFLSEYQTEQVGMASLILGAGRIQQTDKIDPVAGVQLHKKLGDQIQKGEPLFTLFGSSQDKFSEASNRLLNTINITEEKKQAPKLTEKTIVELI